MLDPIGAIIGSIAAVLMVVGAGFRRKRVFSRRGRRNGFRTIRRKRGGRPKTTCVIRDSAPVSRQLWHPFRLFHESVFVNTTAAVQSMWGATDSIIVNTLSDPFQDLSVEDPYGFPEWSNFYQKFRVQKGTVNVEFRPNQAATSVETNGLYFYWNFFIKQGGVLIGNRLELQTLGLVNSALQKHIKEGHNPRISGWKYISPTAWKNADVANNGQPRKRIFFNIPFNVKTILMNAGLREPARKFAYDDETRGTTSFHSGGVADPDITIHLEIQMYTGDDNTFSGTTIMNGRVDTTIKQDALMWGRGDFDV